MSTFSEKLWDLFVPVVLVCLCFVFLYSFVCWLIFILLSLAYPPDSATHILVIGLLSFLVIYFFLGERLSFIPSHGRNDLKMIFAILVWAMFLSSTLLTWEFIESATGKTARLNKISEIDARHATRYYIVPHLFADVAHASTSVSREVTAKSTTLTFRCYIAIPVYDTLTDTLDNYPPAWLGIKYEEEHDNYISDESKERLWSSFIEKHITHLDDSGRPHFTYLLNLQNSDEQENYDTIIANGRRNIVLSPVNTPFNKRADIGVLEDAIITFMAFNVILLIFIATAKIRI